MANRSKIDSLSRDMAALFANPKYSDLEIHCQGKVFSVHRAVVCARSKVLAAECDGVFKEAGERIVKHEMFDSATMGRMLRFMYEDNYETDVEAIAIARSERTDVIIAATDQDDYTEPHITTTAIPSESVEGTARKEGSINIEITLAHANVYFIADFYDVSDLKALALRQFGEWGSPIEPEEFTEVLTTIYSNTLDRGDPLRKKVVSQALLRLPSLLHCEHFMCAVSDLHELQNFTADLLTGVYQQVSELDERTVGLEAELTSSRTKISSVEARLNGSNAAKDKQYSEFEELTTLVFNTPACRNCNKDFGSYIDTIRRFGSPAYLVRCRHCLCKHLD